MRFRTATYRDQAKPTVVCDSDRWLVFDDDGHLFASCPFQTAVAPLSACYGLTMTPTLTAWRLLDPGQQRLVDLIEMCLTRAPIDASKVTGPLYQVLPGSPWYITAPETPPEPEVFLPRKRRVRTPVVTEETIAPLTTRRFMREDD